MEQSKYSFLIEIYIVLHKALVWDPQNAGLYTFREWGWGKMECNTCLVCTPVKIKAIRDDTLQYVVVVGDADGQTRL